MIALLALLAGQPWIDPARLSLDVQLDSALVQLDHLHTASSTTYRALSALLDPDRFDLRTPLEHNLWDGYRHERQRAEASEAKLAARSPAVVAEQIRPQLAPVESGFGVEAVILVGLGAALLAGGVVLYLDHR